VLLRGRRVLLLLFQLPRQPLHVHRDVVACHRLASAPRHCTRWALPPSQITSS
jgi:hypothetical protein